jgi:hypothetical protein
MSSFVLYVVHDDFYLPIRGSEPEILMLAHIHSLTSISGGGGIDLDRLYYIYTYIYVYIYIWFQEIKRMMTMHSTHGLFLT